MNPPSKEDTILETLIDSELAASETYRLALESLGGERHAGDLRRIESDHRQAVGLLRERCRRPAAGARARALWTGSAEPGTPQPKDALAALPSLRAGEENEIREYESALENPVLGDEAKRLIASLLLPQTRSHLQTLVRYESRLGR